MSVSKKYSVIVFLSVLAFVLSACGAKSNDSIIATSVAMTVQAEHTQDAQQQPTPTQQAPVVLTLPAAGSPTAAATKAPPTAPSGSSDLCTAEASYVSETVPDGTITSPGSTFTKTWRIKNTGTCPWNNTWQFVYSSGDAMGGSGYYNLPGVVMPGDTLNMSIVLTAPADNGTYTGYWKIKSPWGALISDVSGNSYSVQIVVGSGTPANSKTETAYGITNVTYDVTRECTSANTFYTITAYISSNGPVTAKYTWVQSDGNSSNKGTITFDAASTRSPAPLKWSQHIGSSAATRWVQIIVTSPSYQEFPKLTLPGLCW